MKTFLIFIVFLLISIVSFAQTFNSTGATSIATDGVDYYNDITVSGIGVITVGGNELSSLTIDITHTYDGDLDIYLVAPDASQIELSTDNGGASDNYTNTVFSDAGATTCVGQSAPFTGTYKPELGTIASLNNGQNADGVWRLRVYDDTSLDVGTINSWNITFSPPLTCPAPTNLTATNIAATQADLGWTENGSAITWDIELGPSGFSPTGTATQLGVTANPYTYTSLSLITSYDYYVRADCGASDYSTWVGPFNFTTSCAAISSFPYCESFDGITEDCWTVNNNNADFDEWNLDYASNPRTGSELAGLITDGNTGNNDDYLITPPIVLTANQELKYWYRVASSFEPNEFEVLLSTTGNSPANFTTTLLANASYSNTTYQEQVININAYSGTVYIAFHVPNGSLDGWVLYIDDVCIDGLPTCPDPTSLTATSIAATQANLGWTENGSATTWDIELGPSGFSPTGIATQSGVTANPYTYTGLSATTSYDYYVRADCGASDYSTWVGPFNFTTPCSSEIAPWNEDFENAGSIPNCWSQGASNSENWLFANTASGNHIGNNGTAGGSTTSGSYFAWVDDSSPDNTGTTLESPPIDVSALTMPELSFYLISNNEGNSNVDFSVDVWDGAAWNVGHYTHNTNTANGEWELITVSLSSLTITGDLKFRFVVDEIVASDFYDDVAIDDVDIHEAPTCPDPTNLTATSIATTQADLGWTENGSATTWDIELGTSGFSPTGTATQAGVTANPYTYTSLSPSTSYDYYVRADCGASDYSTWVGPFNFTTQILVGQIFVSATGGTLTETYNTLKLTFDAINAGTHTGVIIITAGNATGQTITEIAEAKLNKSGVGSASYTSVSIYPGAANIKITGAISGACCVTSGIIKLDQAENVTVDGRQGGVGSTIDLTIENTTVGSYSSAFVFMAASNNFLKYTTLKSAVTGTCCGGGTLGIIDNNTGGGAGSSNNIVEYCNITKSGSNVPRRAIFGKGASGRENNNNVIRNCNIFDFQEFGIFLGSSSSSEGYNRDWIIEENTIYQTIAQTGMTFTQAAISIGTPYTSSGSGYKEEGHFIVRNNTIGGNGSGGDWVWSTTGSYYFMGIFINDGFDVATVHSEIYGNVIQDLDITTGNANSSSSKPIFGGIVAYNCKVRIGSLGGNTIGSLTDPSSIILSKTADGGYAAGISVSSNSDQNNSINNNIVSGISNTTGSNYFTSFSGIYNSSGSTYPHDSIFSNNVSYLTFSKVNYFNGIYGQGFIAKNRVRDIDFNSSSTTGELIGISWGGGEITAGDSRGVENNEVILGLNKAGSSVAGNDVIKGIELRRGDDDVYYNSVLIQGVATNSDPSFAIELPGSGTTLFHNNLMYNERTGGTGKHYAVSNSLGAGFTSSHNAYVIGNTANNLIGIWSGVDQAILAAWQTASGETNSIADNAVGQPTSTMFPLLISQDNLDVSDPTWLNAGVPSVALTDIRNVTRSISIPTIGAYEKNPIIDLPVQLLSFKGKCMGETAEITWETASEINNDYFVLQKSMDVKSWVDFATIKGAGNSNSLVKYEYLDEDLFDGIIYYRLKQVDYNGEFSYSETIILNCNSEITNISFYPNPTSGNLYFSFKKLGESRLDIVFFNKLGQQVWRETYDIDNSDSVINIDISSLSDGMYFVKVITIDGDIVYSDRIIIDKD